jgi:hypothetical protein
VTDVTTGQGQEPVELSAADEQVLRELSKIGIARGRSDIGAYAGGPTCGGRAVGWPGAFHHLRHTGITAYS